MIDAALLRHTQGKPHVERNVQYLRESSFRGEDFVDLAHVQRERPSAGAARRRACACTGRPAAVRSTDHADCPAGLAPYARCDPEAVIRQGRRQEESIGRFLEQLLADPVP